MWRAKKKEDLCPDLDNCDNCWPLLIGFIANEATAPTGGNPSRESASTPAPGEPPTAAPAETSSKGHTTAYNVGQTAHVGYTTYAVSKVFYRSQLGDNFLYANELPDASFLFVELTVKNDDKQARTIAPFTLIDETGSEYETSSKAWAVNGGIGALDNLNPGVQKKGVIVFDMPKGKHCKLQISGGYWSTDRALVNLGL